MRAARPGRGLHFAGTRASAADRKALGALWALKKRLLWPQASLPAPLPGLATKGRGHRNLNRPLPRMRRQPQDRAERTLRTLRLRRSR